MRSISRVLDEFTQYVHDSNTCPQTVDEAVCLLEDHSTRYQSLKESIVSSSMKGEEVLTEMKHGNPSSQLPRSAVNNISAVERYEIFVFNETLEKSSSQLTRSALKIPKSK